MDGGHSSTGTAPSTSCSSSSSSSGPAPFLIKTYDMVDDSTTDDIVSWSSAKNSFVVWNPPEFARLLLPTYFKHNNFSSFIRQLNTYGFRKIDPERWEFANEDFSKDNKHLLKNIHRRKPIHSHSQPPQQGTGSFGDAERAALEEEIDKLMRDKTTLQSNLSRFRQQQQGTKFQLETLEQRLLDMEQRQQRMLSFLAKAVNNPSFVEHLVRMAGPSMDFASINKKRRLPIGDFCQEVVENNFVDNQIVQCPSIGGTSKMEFVGQTFHWDFSNKLKLELSPANSDSLVSAGMQSSNEDGASPQRKPPPEGAIRDVHLRTEGFPFAIDTLDLLDTGTSFSLRNNSSSSGRVRRALSPELHGLRHYSKCAEEGDGNLSCHLNLTLSSSPLQVQSGDYLARVAPSLGQDKGTTAELRSGTSDNEANIKVITKGRSSAEDANMSSEVAPSKIQASVPTVGRVNDIFWEQFLTERPGSSDTEEASSSFRENPCDEQEERKPGITKSWNSKQSIEQLTL